MSMWLNISVSFYKKCIEKVRLSLSLSFGGYITQPDSLLPPVP